MHDVWVFLEDRTVYPSTTTGMQLVATEHLVRCKAAKTKPSVLVCYTLLEPKEKHLCTMQSSRLSSLEG